jgi:uncharacterized cupredoxin-like copper-binding protein
MKKLTFAVFAFAALTSGAIAAETPNTVRASLELTKNGTPVFKVELAMLEGRRTPYNSVSTRSYVASCEPDSAGNMIVKPASLKIGMTADVTPVQVNADGALLTVTFNYSELDGMKNAQVKGCAVEIPSTHDFGNSVAVRVKPGQSVELPSYSGNDKYVLVVRGL